MIDDAGFHADSSLLGFLDTLHVVLEERVKVLLLRVEDLWTFFRVEQIQVERRKGSSEMFDHFY